MNTSLHDYDYALPRELIALRPLPRRQDARMMVLDRERQTIDHRRFVELPQFVRPGDLLVLNDTRVQSARRSSDDGASFSFWNNSTRGDGVASSSRDAKCGSEP